MRFRLGVGVTPDVQSPAVVVNLQPVPGAGPERYAREGRRQRGCGGAPAQGEAQGRAHGRGADTLYRLSWTGALNPPSETRALNPPCGTGHQILRTGKGP